MMNVTKHKLCNSFPLDEIICPSDILSYIACQKQLTSFFAQSMQLISLERYMNDSTCCGTDLISRQRIIHDL